MKYKTKQKNDNYLDAARPGGKERKREKTINRNNVVVLLIVLAHGSVEPAKRHQLAGHEDGPKPA